MSTSGITHLIINSPYQEPKKFWRYKAETKRWRCIRSPLQQASYRREQDNGDGDANCVAGPKQSYLSARRAIFEERFCGRTGPDREEQIASSRSVDQSILAGQQRTIIGSA